MRIAGEPGGGRTGPRLIAAAGLVAAVAIVAVGLVVLGGQGGGGGSDGGVAADGRPEQPLGAGRVRLPNVAKVRNARPQPGWGPYSGPVPILRFSVVGKAPPRATVPELFVPPADFRAQLDWLEAHGYEGVGLEAVQAAWSGKGTLPAKPVVLTFDGVEGRLLDVVVPELRRRGWPGVLVLDADAPPRRLAAVARLIALGWDVEPSGHDPGAARRFVRTHFAVPARNFAYPSPESSLRTAAVRAAGFDGATSIGGGFAEPSHPFDMPRITIFELSGVEGFAEAMRSHGSGVGA